VIPAVQFNSSRSSFDLSKPVTRFQYIRSIQATSMREHRMSLCSEKRGGVISRHEGTSTTFLRNNARPIIHRGCCTPWRIYLSWFVKFRVATIHCSNLLVRPCIVPHRRITQNFDSVRLIGLLD